MIHGGDILSFKDLYSGTIIDFSSNINPLGPPECIKEALRESFENVLIYPDIQYRELKKEIANYLGCKGSEVIVGNGAVEIIDGIISMFDRVVVFEPCFIEYTRRADIHKKEIVRLTMKDDFSIDETLLHEILKSGDLIILGNPNNPTGRRIKKNMLINIVSLIKERGAFLLLDEAFFEFCDDDYDSIDLFEDSKNLCVIRAATKFFSLPGIRLGYAFTGSDMVKRYDKRSLPWSVNSFAEAAGRVIFKDKAYIKEAKEYMRIQRNFMIEELDRTEILKVYKTDCNFILVKLLKGNENHIFDFMIKRGILIRKASSFSGLDETYIRLAIKDFDKNRYLIDCLKEYEKCMQ